MDRRFNERISTDLPVRLTQLEDSSEWLGQLQDISDSGICSLFAVPFAPGAIVKLEILGLTLYGQIVYSDLWDDAFRTGIFIEPALLDSSNITELVKNHLIAAAGRS
jgi:PilZ domain